MRSRASTADVVGQRLSHERVPAKWKAHHDRLMRLRSYLLSRQDDLVQDAREEQSGFSLHMADAGTDSFDRDLALSCASSGQDAVYEIDQALTRIREGTYGRCELTGKAIDAARLEAIPWARFSREAEERLEREGSFHRTRLSPREALARGTTGAPESEGASSGSQTEGD